MTRDVVHEFLKVFGRTEEELFDGEKKYIQLCLGDYNTDRHQAFEIKKEECAGRWCPHTRPGGCRPIDAAKR